ncbi:MAG TPA: hypothetical protein PLV85_17785, partial [Polyangiaceae bacterium]|nr:hypothetical protein [Polyangiaceae bacterium]
MIRPLASPTPNPFSYALTTLAIASLAACSSWLGFDDVEFESAAGNGGSGGLGNTGGVAGQSGSGGSAGATGGEGGNGGTGATAGIAGSAGDSGVGGSATGGAAGTAGSAGGPAGNGGGAGCVAVPESPLPCSTPLADRIRRTSIPGAAYSEVFLSPQPSGCSKMAWLSNGTIQVTPLDGADQPFSQVASTQGSQIRGLVAHDDGSAVLVVRDDKMVLVRLAANGLAQFENIIVGGNSHQAEGDRWIDNWPHEGRLAWSGSEYAAYFGHTGNWGSQGNHQGDRLEIIDATGNGGGGGWGWGCSHSLDVRIAHNIQRFGPVCLSDCYPGKGIYFDHHTLVSDEPSGNCIGGSNARLGGLAAVDGGFWLTYSSSEGRASSDIALVHIDDAGAVSP